MPTVPLGEYYNSDLAVHNLHVFSASANINHATTVQPHEIEMLKKLVSEAPADATFSGAIKEDVSELLNTHVMINNTDNDSNISLSLEFKTGTALASENKEYNEKLNVIKTNAPQLFVNTVSLGVDTAPLYNGNIKFEYYDGDSTYSSVVGEHYIAFDTTDNDYNMQKAFNSTLSNTDLAASNGITGAFDETFNSNNAFYTNKILTRNTDNTIAVGSAIGDKCITTSAGNAGDDNWEKLESEILSSTNYPDSHPLFGALQFTQDPLSITFVTNNVGSNSTLSKVLNSTNLTSATQASDTSQPDTSFSEEQFIDLFTSSQLSNVGPGYDFKVGITADSTDGYSLLTSSNTISIPSYNTDNINVVDNNTSEIMFTIDDSALVENALYMKEMKDNGYLTSTSHKLHVKNGSLLKDPSNESNPNYNYFTILDGVESLIATGDADIIDLSGKGSITVINSNNTLGDGNSRYKKYTDNTYLNTTSTSSRVNKLVVSYSTEESDYRPDTGIIDSLDLKNSYFIQSQISTLNNSTSSLHNVEVFSPTKYPYINAARADNSALVFQSQPNSALYSSSNISSYQASGLNSSITPGNFALFSLTKTLSFEDSDESSLFKTSDNAAVDGVVTHVSITNIDLTSFDAQDIRVVINGKTKTDIPQPNDFKWNWAVGNDVDGTLSDYNVDSNDQFLISKKEGLDYLGNLLYEVFKLDPTENITVEYKLRTDSEPLPSKDILDRSAQVIINFSSISNPIIINVESDDTAFFNISDNTSSGVVQSLDNLQNIQDYYEVKKYVTTKEYHVAIRSRIGSYSNLWIVRQVKEFTEWFQLTNTKNNKVMPDYYLNNILLNGSQKFKARRYFDTGLSIGSVQPSELSTIINFKVKDLMGFRASVEYDNGTEWLPFKLKDDSNYEHAIDPMHDIVTTITLMDPSDLSKELGIMRITIDTPIYTSLGLNTHISQANLNNEMYMINLTVPQGTSSFSITGYTYDVEDSQYINKDTIWSPYAVGEALFLKNDSDTLVGTQMPNLSTLVELVDPTPTHASNANEINKVKVTIKQNSNELFSFVSDKFVLENFNIIYQPEVLIQHDYIISKTSYVPTQESPAFLSGTEYLSSTYVSTDLDIVNLKFGSSYNGIRAELAPASTTSSTERVSSGNFRLSGDRVYITPLNEDITVNSSNKYVGRYATATGEEITASVTGAPLPTTSVIHRNIHPTSFRGLQNDQPVINILRTPTSVKLVVGTKYFDDMNTLGDSNVSLVWADRSTYNGQDATLKAMKLHKATSSFTSAQLSNMSIISGSPADSNGDIGSIGFTVSPKFSMYPSAILSSHKIDIELSASSYQKTISNALNTSLDVSVSSSLFDYSLHEFKDFALIATRIKVYSDENYNFKYGIPDLIVAHSPQYIGDPTLLTNWTQIQTYTDAELRTGVIIGSGTSDGVVKFTKTQTFVSSYTKFCTLPRPVATLSSYDVSDLTASLPHGYASKSYLPKTYGFDINITNADGTQGLAANLQNHMPFSKNPSTGVANQLNAVTSTYGLNNLTLGLNVSNYLYLRESANLPTKNFSFTMSSNKLKLSNGIGLTANSPVYKVLFDDYISELSDSSKWDTELGPTIDNSFGTAKKWNLNIKQLTDAISEFINLSPSTLTNNSVIINGITSYGIDSYTLDLILLDSVKMRIYKVNHVYDSVNDIQKVVFYRYSSAEGLPYTTQDDFSKSALFKPLIIAKETCEMTVSVPNSLTPFPYNVNALIKNAITSSNFNLSWASVTPFTSIKSSISFVPLSSRGAGSFLELLQLTKENPLKVLTSSRPCILDIRRADGSRAFAINYDGKVLAHRIVTKRIELLPQTNYSNAEFDFLPGVYNDHTVDANNDE